MRSSRLHLLLLTSILLFCYLVLSSAEAKAQQSNVSVSISANVTRSIEMVTLRSMQLSGEDAQNGIITIDPTSSPNAGKMVAYGNPNSDIRISYLPTRELTRIQGTDVLTFTYQIAGNQQEDQTTAEPLETENRDFSFNDNGEFYLWIGGSVNISTAVPGNYQGEFTLEIEYI